MKKILLLAACSLAAVSQIQAQVIADWTFETSAPTTAGPISPEIGAGSATGSHAGTTVYSSPAGNGSSHSYSSTDWAVGDYYQVQVSTIGLAAITLTYDQISSSTGPGKFLLEYSTDGSTFTPVTGTDYTVLVNASPNTWGASTHITTTTYTDDLSAITAINNQATVYFRFADDATTSAGGGTVATAGTDRMDNIVVAVVPEPSSIVLLGVGMTAAGLFVIRRRK